ncbi:endonuclease/exonuclease/phosphatase family protein [Sphingobacterium sp. UBA6320]|uniref:endonuclease/exonuclease/phosphatase family protein n=1 Tax=Sphingobacterium sp. UBA6320 TaxID=1947510 RepID=UPI0025DB7CED|nr:endonuclease/exonuclease/phosphatase family protein [Sphingobacterium sp. UBA6320]
MINPSQPHPIRIRSLMGKSAYVILMLITSLSFLALYISPETFVLFQWIGVVLPLLLCCNLFLLIIALYKRSWYSICPLIAILANFHYYPHKFQMHQPEEGNLAEIKFATYNVHEFKMIYNISSMEHIAEYFSAQQLNTLCLQEIPADCTEADLRQVFTSMPYVLTTGGDGKHFQLAILSKYPLDSISTISFPERPNCALFADMTVNSKKIRIANFHLQTTNWNQVKGTLLHEEHTQGSWADALGVISSNFRFRGKQVDSLRSILDRSPYPLIVSGDFNNTPVSYGYRILKGDLNDAYQEAGNGYGYTYRYFMKLYRIDFVLYSGTTMQARNYRLGAVEYSDHLPVLVDLDIK